jgi:YesN/AraC family two-component response regulator
MGEYLSILIVDDKPSSATSLADVLDAKGLEVYTANSGAEALEILRERSVDIMLTDVKMPEMNGVMLYREARKIRPALTTILMTAYAADDLIRQGMAEGIKTVLSKPLDIDFLLLIISSLKKIIP